MLGVWRIFRANLWMSFAFRGRKDEAGKPYIRHLRLVALTSWAMAPAGSRCEAAVVGLLSRYPDEIDPLMGVLRIRKRFGHDTAVRVNRLTSQPNLPGWSAIDHVLEHGDTIAKVVKLAECLHNTEPNREVLDEKILALRTQYGRGILRPRAKRSEIREKSEGNVLPQEVQFHP